MEQAIVWMTALVMPAGLWFVEQIIPYGVLVEELAKLWLLWRLILSSQDLKWQQAAGLGAVFGASEAVLYLLNANILANASGWWLRLLLTVPMHAATVVIMWLLWKRSKWLGLILAIAAHALFNRLV